MAENDELEAKIKANKEKYGDFVRKLYASDNNAWEEIYKNVVLVGLRYHTSNGYCLGKIAKDRCLTEYDILSDLFELMIAKRKLDLYSYSGDIYAWMRYYIKEIVLKVCDDETVVMEPEKLQNKREASDDGSENGPDAAYMGEAGSKTMTEMEKLEASFAKLFKTNPKGATILLLHERDGLTSNAICGVLGMPQDTSHINHVDNAFRQASEEIQRIMKQL